MELRPHPGLLALAACVLAAGVARADDPPKVHHPLKIGAVTIGNRIARSSLAGITDGEFGEVNPQRIALEENFAAGGAGLIISSHVPILANGRVLPNYAMIDSDERIPEWRAVVKAVEAQGGKYFMQLSHSGRQQDMGGIQNKSYEGGEHVDVRPPSPGSRPDTFHGLQGRMMSTDEMKEMVQHFVAAARRAAKAGVHGLELHSSNGYFFTQVISRSSNDRTDEYGGELKNRFRFWKEVIEGIKNDPETKHLPLVVKLSVIEDAGAVKPWARKGNTIAESIQVAKWAEEAGADAIHVSAGDIFPHPRNPAGYLPVEMLKDTYGGLYTSGKLSKLNFGLLRTPARELMRLAWERRHRKELYPSFVDYLRGKEPDPSGPDAAWRKLEGALAGSAAKIKRELKTAKVLVTGGWQSLGPIQRGLARGDFDMVTSARTFLANVDLPKQLVEASRRGEKDFEPKSPCSLCNRCLVAAPRHPVACLNAKRFAGATPEARKAAMEAQAKRLYTRLSAQQLPRK